MERGIGDRLVASFCPFQKRLDVRDLRHEVVGRLAPPHVALVLAVVPVQVARFSAVEEVAPARDLLRASWASVLACTGGSMLVMGPWWLRRSAVPVMAGLLRCWPVLRPRIRPLLLKDIRARRHGECLRLVGRMGAPGGHRGMGSVRARHGARTVSRTHLDTDADVTHCRLDVRDFVRDHRELHSVVRDVRRLFLQRALLLQQALCDHVMARFGLRGHFFHKGHRGLGVLLACFHFSHDVEGRRVWRG